MTDSCINVFQIRRHKQTFKILNFVNRLAQIREGGIQSKIRQQHLTSHEHEEAQL
jgi:hypothetical protein